MMKHFSKLARTAIATAFAFSLLVGISPAQASDLSWTPQDGDVLDFKVLRKGKEFGRHKVSFSRDGDRFEVQNDIELEVKIGPFRAFYYGHESTELWENGQLVSMEGTTRKDGDDLTMRATRENGAISVVGTNYTGSADAGIIPSSHWNMGEVQSDVILSSEGGELLPVEIEYLGEEQIVASGETITADRYRLNSELSVDLWYDKSGRWVKCSFEARGQTIEYVLQ